MSNKRLKVLQITAMYPNATDPAFGTFVKSQIDSLMEHADVELLVVKGGNGVLPYLMSIPHLLKILYKGFDIIHVHFGSLASLIKLIYFGKTPVITSYCGGDLYGKIKDNERGLYFNSMIYRAVNKRLSGLDAWSITKSQNLADEIEAFAKNIAIIPNGVDMTKFNVRDKEQCKEELGIDKNKKTILFPADTNNPRKNFALLENALTSLGDEDYTLLTFKGRNINPEQIPTYMNASDLVVCTSLEEGSPNIIKEAMACNCTVFSTDCGDVTQLLEGVNDGKIIEYEEDKWAKALKGFLRNDEVKPSNSREMLIRKGLDDKSVAKEILEVYQNAIK